MSTMLRVCVTLTLAAAMAVPASAGSACNAALVSQGVASFLSGSSISLSDSTCKTCAYPLPVSQRILSTFFLAGSSSAVLGKTFA